MAQEFRFNNGVSVAVALGGRINLHATLSVPDEHLISDYRFYFHWGLTKRSASAEWVDEEIPASGIVASAKSQDLIFTLNHAFEVSRVGRFSGALYAIHVPSGRHHWMNQSGFADASFVVGGDYESDSSVVPLARIERALGVAEIEGHVLQSLVSYESFVKMLHKLHRQRSVRGLGKIIFDLTRAKSELRQVISSYYQKAIEDLANEPSGLNKTRLTSAVEVLQGIGIGEIVFVSPEGPHAIAGGLAQVICGLMGSLSHTGLAVTMISLLYEEKQGNKHVDAETLIAEGIPFQGEYLPLEKKGEVRVSFGPTMQSFTSDVATSRLNVTADVYVAEAGLVRMIFLRHRDFSRKLYEAVGSEDQLRRALFLSRGALEVIKDEKFSITPDVLVSNDWLTALVPALIKTDTRFARDEKFSSISTVHVLHNCGRDYQGKFSTQNNGVDIWPLLDLGPEHYMGLADPNDISQLNITAGAINHVGKAVLTVSRPYAEQLLTEEGGEGLDRLMRYREDAVFGISNGVDLGELRKIFWNVGNDARRNFFGEKANPRKKFSDDVMIDQLPKSKLATKLQVQERFSLIRDERATVISFVGRLAEQKGIGLLTELTSRGVSVLEDTLSRFPDVQFIFGGPPTPGDSTVLTLKIELARLQALYPGRVAAHYDFIKHREALEITKAADLFLMPSRYEPGGITQLEALAAGTLVVARNVGGIAATLIDYSSSTLAGNAFLFSEYSADALSDALVRGVQVVGDNSRHATLIEKAAHAENDWSDRVPKYMALLQYISGALSRRQGFSHLSSRNDALRSIRPSLVPSSL